jgi:lipoate-protein ligase A
MAEVSVTLTLTLPEDIAADAESSGLLRVENVERLITEEVARQRRIDEFFDVIRELHTIEPQITQEEIDEEIRLYREEKRQRKEQQALQ